MVVALLSMFIEAMVGFVALDGDTPFDTFGVEGGFGNGCHVFFLVRGLLPSGE